ncbi:hypothetical protein [Spirochaeta africana]|uniref:Uncharacterized protein n=1 Tax=Spirochaeta africana (strain ATCC 700263 / DSM 8902 / Z-7692) TaxID=889378 RepID=H9UF87_SPIAZ|nr:hypothetical protein [Spirochaeta africana]AFG36180.1 hypothetical protein Spiaf_0071 [Spirochaeta africana DSM 8902]
MEWMRWQPEKRRRAVLVLLMIVATGSVALMADDRAASGESAVPQRYLPGDRLDQAAYDYYSDAMVRPAGRDFRPAAGQRWDGMEFLVARPARSGRQAAAAYEPQLILVQVGAADPVPIGFRQGKAGYTEYILDFMGDGRLDHVTAAPAVPFWVLYRAGGNPAARSRTLLMYMDYHLEGLESPVDPYRRGASHDELLAELERAARDPAYLNRDMAFHLHFSLTQGQRYPEQVYYSWMYLGSAINERYGFDHALPAVESIRYAYRLGRMVEAMEWIRFLQRIRQGLVAAQIYDTLTESDPDARERKRQWVINRNPDHWWVRQALE